MLARGTLVWVNVATNYTPNMSVMLEKYGNLWVVDGIAMRGDGPTPSWYWCKSLSNPDIIYDWREDELSLRSWQDLLQEEEA